MAFPSGIKAADGYVVDASRGSSVSEGSTIAPQYRDIDSFDDDDDCTQYPSDPRPRSIIGRLLHRLGMTVRRRRRSDYDYCPAEGDDLADGVLKRDRRRSRPSPPRELRRCRRSFVAGCFRRSLLFVPLLVLAAFGVLHLVEVLLGQALFWDSDLPYDFLPSWGKPGHEGEGLANYPTDATRDVLPIACHSHNDYWRRVPLFDAIYWGCTGVEADVWLFDEELYVGHNTAALTKNRTFKNLYVNPLVNLLDTMNQNNSISNTSTTNHGVFDEDPNQSLILLIDFKTAGHDTFPYVSQQLSALREKNYLTYWDGSKVHSRAVTVVGTGNTPFDMVVQNTTYRDIFFDAPLDRLWQQPNESRSNGNSDQDSAQGTVGTGNITSIDDFNPASSYYASVSFTHSVGFVWRGRLSKKQLNIIRGQVRGAHLRGLKVRYWDTPSWPVNLRNHVWHVLMHEGADMLNVDDLKAAAVENWKRRQLGFW